MMLLVLIKIKKKTNEKIIIKNRIVCCMSKNNFRAYLSRAVNREPGIRPGDPQSWTRFIPVNRHPGGKILGCFENKIFFGNKMKKQLKKKIGFKRNTAFESSKKK